MQWNSEIRHKILLAINNTAITKVTRESLFQAVAAKLRKYFNHDRLSINLYDAKSGTISYFASADGIEPEGISGKGTRPLENGTITKMIITSGKSVVINNLKGYSGFPSIRSMLDAGLTATMAFPLIIHSRTLGSIHFSFKKEPEHLLQLTEVLEEISRQITLAVDNMLTYTSLKDENTHLEREKRFLMASHYQSTGENEYFYASPDMVEVMNLARQTADSDASILITGETGTGKDYLAQYIHRLSSRRDRLLVKVNCPALTSSLFESELFGHKKGAFTGADSKRIGRFEMAAGGTVFLDEVGELPLPLQAKLLHVLQDKRFERVGETMPIAVDFRIIAATNRDLQSADYIDQFRRDLFYRLNTINIHVPPLRNRYQDVPLLLKKLTELKAREMNRSAPSYSTAAMNLLTQYQWPGNVRELKNTVDRFVILKSGEQINDQDVLKFTNITPEATSVSETAAVSAPAASPLSPQSFTTEIHASDLSTLAEAERHHIEAALYRCSGIVGGKKGAAALLGIPRSTLQYRLRKYGIDAGNFVRNTA